MACVTLVRSSRGDNVICTDACTTDNLALTNSWAKHALSEWMIRSNYYINNNCTFASAKFRANAECTPNLSAGTEREVMIGNNVRRWSYQCTKIGILQKVTTI